MTDRPRAALPPTVIAVVASALLLVLASRLSGQNPATPLTLLSRDQRRTVPVVLVGTQEFVALDDLAAAFQLTIRDESGAITVSYRGRTIVLTTDQALASVAGRLVSLPAPPSRVGGRWLVPLEFINRALAPIYDRRLELRRPSHLVVIGDARVPRVAVRFEPQSNAARLTFDATPRTTSTVSQAAGRLLVKFDADAIDPALPSLPAQGFVVGVRTADAVTLAVELGPRLSTFHASTETTDDTTRLVVDIVGVETTTSAAPPRGAPPPPAPPLQEAAPLASQPVSIRTVALDPGHGGDDTGVKGPGGTNEKDLTLAVARRVKAAIEGRLGVRVLLTRDDDRNVPLDDRVASANNSKADLFISLHANASLRGTPAGASIYVAQLDDGASKTALAPERLPTLSGGNRDIELIEWDRAQLRYLDSSSRLADILKTQLQGRVPLDDDQALSSAPFRVLEAANMPAVLVEMGYLSSADQERQLGGAEFQNAFAQAVVDAVVKFREYLEAGGGELR